MKPFARGQRSRLDALTPALDLVASLRTDAPGLVIDCCCFGLDERGQLSDDRFFVFYNQPAAPAGAIEIEKTASAHNSESFRVRLENLPQSIRRLVFTASIDGAGTMSQMRGGSFSIAGDSGELMRYEFSGQDFGSERALMVAEIYWKDGWRVWAEGQGFAGGLSALLRHFGGEEIVDDTPATIPQTPISVPPAPTSPPVALVSTSAAQAPPPTVASVTDGSALQQLIDDTPPGGTLRLEPGEFSGPIVLRRPLTLQGEGGVIWARSGPVVTVESAQVSLHGVEIQVTDSAAARGNEDVALLVRASTCPSLSGLRVRGRVMGAGDDGGVWKLPDSLDLGVLVPRVANVREMEVDVPAPCSLSCTIAGTILEPATLAAGAHRIRIVVREVPAGSFVCGRIEVRAGEVTRSIALSGRSAEQ
jgi:stress response protein SCP2